MSPKGTTTGIFSGGAFAEASASGSGDLSVAVTPNSATWTIHGPLDFGTDGVETGTGDATFAGSPAGAYYIQWDAVAGYITPMIQGLFLEDAGSETFTAVYVDTVNYGPEHWPLEQLRTDLSDLSEVQSFLGVANSTLAKARILICLEEADEDTLDALRPYILLHYADEFEAEMVAGGTSNWFTYRGSLDMMFESDVPAELADSTSGAIVALMKELGMILAALLELSGTGGRLNTKSIRRQGSPWRAKETKRVKRDFVHCDYRVEWGV